MGSGCCNRIGNKSIVNHHPVIIQGEKEKLMGDYKYEDPLTQGYKQFKLTKKQHNKLFKYRQIKWRDRYEYYYNDKYILLYRFTNWKAIILITLLFPVILLLEGLLDYKETIKDYKGMYNQKKYGAFSSDSVPSGTDTYVELIKSTYKKT